MHALKASWRTSAAGIGAALAAIGDALAAQFDGVPETAPDWGLAVTAVALAAGLLFARDNGVSSEKAGLR